MAKWLPRMELYWGIYKAVCRRMEKGAADTASEYLNKQYSDVEGFTPQSLRRMRDFYRTSVIKKEDDDSVPYHVGYTRGNKSLPS